MALVVEDGTGLANADAYVSVADADAYVAAYQPEGAFDWENVASASEKEVYIRKATQWLDSTYVNRWKGSRINAEMSLDWPRNNVWSEGALLPADELPTRLVQACVEIALRYQSGEVTADVETSVSGIKRERSHLGPLQEEIEYSGSKSTQKRLPKVDALLSALTHSSDRLRLA